MLDQIKETYEFLINQIGDFQPVVGIVLGTGLGKLVDDIEIQHEVSYEEIPNFVKPTVEFHSGRLLFGILGDKKVVCMQGRFHLYEGYSLQEITFPIRVLKALGVKKLLVSNAAGAINLTYKKGDMMLIDDHINLQGGSPLAFKNVSDFGHRFADMSAPYDTTMNAQLLAIAQKNNGSRP